MRELGGIGVFKADVCACAPGARAIARLPYAQNADDQRPSEELSTSSRQVFRECTTRGREGRVAKTVGAAHPQPVSKQESEVGKERWEVAEGGVGDAMALAAARFTSEPAPVAPKNSSLIQYQHKSQNRQHRHSRRGVWSPRRRRLSCFNLASYARDFVSRIVRQPPLPPWWNSGKAQTGQGWQSANLSKRQGVAALKDSLRACHLAALVGGNYGLARQKNHLAAELAPRPRRKRRAKCKRPHAIELGARFGKIFRLQSFFRKKRVCGGR
jgi:hypothetical protein